MATREEQQLLDNAAFAAAQDVEEHELELAQLNVRRITGGLFRVEVYVHGENGAHVYLYDAKAAHLEKL